jgi:hypothetical protein
VGIQQELNADALLPQLIGMAMIVSYVTDKESSIQLWELVHVQILKNGMELIVLMSVQRVMIKLENCVFVLLTLMNLMANVYLSPTVQME